ncbi:hypothetical protein C8R45DRAFT_1103918 [Mycena sanguinolenta]|nr:hypothetical protein C8R45DRAFT_1103918 [Mycena sanguinolenta]
MDYANPFVRAILLSFVSLLSFRSFDLTLTAHTARVEAIYRSTSKNYHSVPIDLFCNRVLSLLYARLRRSDSLSLPRYASAYSPPRCRWYARAVVWPQLAGGGCDAAAHEDGPHDTQQTARPVMHLECLRALVPLASSLKAQPPARDKSVPPLIRTRPAYSCLAPARPLPTQLFLVRQQGLHIEEKMLPSLLLISGCRL